jgi:hypothetical protein
VYSLSAAGAGFERVLDIPPFVTYGENVLRIVVLVLPFLMPLGGSRGQTRRGRRGSRFLVTRKTVCGVSMCFAANRPSCAHTGCLS